MRQENILFEKALQRITLFWKFTGMQINYDKRTQDTFLGHLRKRWFYIASFIGLTSGVIADSVMIGTFSREVILYMTPCITIAILADVKSFFFVYYEDNVCDIISTLRTLQSDDSEGKQEVDNDFVNNRLPFLNTANKLLLFMVYMGVTTFCVGPLIVIAWLYWSTNEFKLFLPFTIWYPFDGYSFKGWPFAYLHQFWSAWIVGFYIYGADCFFYTTCGFIHNQFYSLQFDLKKIGSKSFRNKDSFKRHIGALIHHHRELIRCINLLNVIYGKSTLFNVVSSSFIICLAGFNVMAIDNMIMMTPFAAVTILESTQIFLFCYYGDLLMRASIQVSDAIFYSEWYGLDASSMKYCLFMVMRASKPCKIKAFGYSDINLQTFARILSSAWSYFTLLKTMYSQ